MLTAFELCQVELIQSGALGEITEIHAATDRPVWPQGYDRPPGEESVPQTLDWDLWAGPAAVRPYQASWPAGHPVYSPESWKRFIYQKDPKLPLYHPFTWRGWIEFGSGAVGDIAPHSLNVVFLALDLGAPSAVEVVETSGMRSEMYPEWTILRWEWAQRGVHPPLKLYWYDGGKLPPATQLIIDINAFITNFWWLLIGAVVGLVALFRVIVASPAGKMGWHRFKWRVPVFSRIPRFRFYAQFARTLGTLTENGVTLLHYAVRFRSPAAVELLLSRGANVNQQCQRSGSTPLHRAVTSTGAPGTAGKSDKAREIIELLLHYGANSSIKNKLGKRPADYVRDPKLQRLLANKRLTRRKATK